MDNLDENIFKIDEAICDNIAQIETLGVGLTSQNILAQLRNLVNAVALKIYKSEKMPKADTVYMDIESSIKYIRSKDNLLFLTRFYDCLQVSVSHYTPDKEGSARLMWKYVDYLNKIKNFLSENYGINILKNLDDFILPQEREFEEYYQAIASCIENFVKGQSVSRADRFYIHKVKPFKIGNEIYYELTISSAIDNSGKFDRFIAFTKLNIPSFYSANLRITNAEILALDKKMSIKIIENFEVSIRPCEMDNFVSIFGLTTNTNTRNAVYKNLMKYLTDFGISLSEVIEFEDAKFYELKDKICDGKRLTPFFFALEQCRKLKGERGYNTLKYLLYHLNNVVIKRQRYYKANYKLSNLKLKYGCIPFEEMPFAFDLVNHNTNFSELLECFSCKNREHELLARIVKNNTEINAKLYTPIEELHGFDDIPQLVQKFNHSISYEPHKATSCLCLENDKIFINGYETNTYKIINRLIELSSDGVMGYEESVDSWLQNASCGVDCDEKKAILKTMFKKSKVALIYGAAGTGKSTLIEHISRFWSDKTKLFLANTHSAVQNLKRKVNYDKKLFMTVKACKNSGIAECDILILDECSTISNQDMVDLLEQVNFKLLVLVGDMFQIESIKFGNWFSIAKSFIPQSAVCELSTPYRTEDKKLKLLWNSVRKLDGKVKEHLDKNSYSSRFDETIFSKDIDDEIVLCLNYDGLYGINNINTFLQDNNTNEAIYWGIDRFKVGDYIIFKDVKRFEKILYNNLKGRIKNISIIDDTKIKFTVEVDTVLNEMEVEGSDLVLESVNSKASTVSFLVNKYKSGDYDDEDDKSIVPFQIAYAISIHKAQGLEYDSVKILITNDMEELITHNIFYTAITRAKNRLKVYWTYNTEEAVLNNMKFMFNSLDANILAQRYGLRLVK